LKALKEARAELIASKCCDWNK